MHWNFNSDKPYFVLDPEGDGITYFATEEERDAFAENCIQQYFEDRWNEDVVNVVAGIVTHSAQQVDREDRPPDNELDEDECDHSGQYWEPDCEYICDYKLKPI